MLLNAVTSLACVSMVLASAPDGGVTRNAEVEGEIDRDALALAMRTQKPGMSRCWERIPGMPKVILSFSIGPKGEVVDPRVDEGTGGGQEKCFVEWLRSLKLPPTKHGFVHVSYVFNSNPAN